VLNKNLLVLVDTTDIRLDKHLGRITDTDGIGIIDKNQHKSSYGFFVHPLYVVDEDNGTPYGIADVKIFNRAFESSGETKAEKKSKMYRIPIEQKESFRWIGPCISSSQSILSEAKSMTYVMDREADIWEVYQGIPQQGVHIVVRSKTNRAILNEKGERIKLHDQLSEQQALGAYVLDYKDTNGSKRKTKINVKAGSCEILPPKHKKGDNVKSMYYVELKSESTNSQGQSLHWILWTDREVTNMEQAKQIVEIYCKRWNIEVFFKLLKSDGYDIESCQLEKGSSIRRLTLILMEAAIKVQQLKAARSGDTELQVKDVFIPQEIKCLRAINKKLEGRTEKQKNPYPEDHLSWASWVIARLAGWKDFYSKKSPPGNKIFVDGLEKFEFLLMGYSLHN